MKGFPGESGVIMMVLWYETKPPLLKQANGFENVHQVEEVTVAAGLC